jgi:hypothetical protein
VILRCHIIEPKERLSQAAKPDDQLDAVRHDGEQARRQKMKFADSLSRSRVIFCCSNHRAKGTKRLSQAAKPDDQLDAVRHGGEQARRQKMKFADSALAEAV